ncbi:unnamed protein product [Ranitomeya imitator]|uniref:P2X purinoreceptor 7 intracellular domain-containing protein n=1 Tax=Ranitomeya imitator TaxID=111125 RepID=A0ABN9KWN0_9NEOB|nr:unnamed protein product [Ranitomeya imitator]
MDCLSSWDPPMKGSPDPKWLRGGIRVLQGVLPGRLQALVSQAKPAAIKLRKTAYRSFTAWIHGYLGAGNRQPIPSCVVNKVCYAFPDDDDEYMGFKPSNDNAAKFMDLE